MQERGPSWPQPGPVLQWASLFQVESEAWACLSWLLIPNWLINWEWHEHGWGLALLVPDSHSRSATDANSSAKQTKSWFALMKKRQVLLHYKMRWKRRPLGCGGSDWWWGNPNIFQSDLPGPKVIHHINHHQQLMVLFAFSFSFAFLYLCVNPKYFFYISEKKRRNYMYLKIESNCSMKS